MASLSQMSMNAQALNNAKWVNAKNAIEGYCFVKGKGALVFYLGKVQGMSVLYPVDLNKNIIGSGSVPNQVCEVSVFAQKKK
jgi:hypothetical protein